MSSNSPTELSAGQFLSLRVAHKGDNHQEYLHEQWCQGQVVAVLGFRKVYGGWYEILTISESRPCWGDARYQCSVTGGIDKGETPLAAAVRELREETGFDAPSSLFVSLGTTFVSKCSDTTCHLFTIDLTDAVAGVASGDGSVSEIGNEMSWCEECVLNESPDPLLGLLYVRWKIWLSKKDDRTISLQINEAEAQVLIRGTDLLSRVMTGQWGSVWDESYAVNSNRAFPQLRNGRDIRNELNILARDCGLNPHGPNGGPSIRNAEDVHDSARIAYDIHQVLRHASHANSAKPKSWSVWAGDPMRSHTQHIGLPPINLLRSLKANLDSEP